MEHTKYIVIFLVLFLMWFFTSGALHSLIQAVFITSISIAIITAIYGVLVMSINHFKNKK